MIAVFAVEVTVSAVPHVNAVTGVPETRAAEGLGTTKDRFIIAGHTWIGSGSVRANQ